jgi:hypothetical protein
VVRPQRAPEVQVLEYVRPQFLSISPMLVLSLAGVVLSLVPSQMARQAPCVRLVRLGHALSSPFFRSASDQSLHSVGRNGKSRYGAQSGNPP